MGRARHRVCDELVQLVRLAPFFVVMALFTACSADPTPTVRLLPTPSLSPTPTAPLAATSNAPKREWLDLVERYRGIVATPVPEQTLYADEPVGTTRSFSILDITAPVVMTVDAHLQYVSEKALWYTSDGLDIPQADLEAAARQFDELIFDSVMQTFAPSANLPGRITILNADPPALAGYFQAANTLPTTTYPFSNERMMLVMNGTLDVGGARYLGTLAHELQHLAHWLVDPTEETWISEGFAELSAALLGLSAFSYQTYLGNPNVSLSNWPEDLGIVASAYSGASLFARYIADRFSVNSLDTLVAQPLDGADGVQAFLDEMTENLSFAELFGDWLVANLGTPGLGVYRYAQSPGMVKINSIVGTTDNLETTVHQLGGTYMHVKVGDVPVQVTFDGEATTPVIPIRPYSGDHCWWSNRGDSIDSTLTRAFDLTAVSSATLHFWSWYDIEEAFDHGYVAVSVDGGDRWEIIEGEFTSSDDPTGSSLGHSYSGRTGGWQEDSMDLTPYAGGPLLVRFNYVTDESTNHAGWCIDDIRVPELDYADDAESTNNWDAQGFFRIIAAGIDQAFVVRVVTGSGSTAYVRNVTLDTNNDAIFMIEESAVIVVGGLTPKTTQPGRFRLMTTTP
jgi:immune inhibitor A